MATERNLHSKLTKLLKTISVRTPEKEFAAMLLDATEVLHEELKVFQLLNKIEECGDDRIKSLVLDTKIELKATLDRSGI